MVWNDKAVLTKLQQLEARLEALEARQQRRRHEPASDTRLLSVVAAAFGGAIFSAKDVTRQARLDAAIRDALGGATIRTVGRWFRRLHGQPHGPYVLRRVGRDGNGALWELGVSADRHTPAGAQRTARAD